MNAAIVNSITINFNKTKCRIKSNNLIYHHQPGTATKEEDTLHKTRLTYIRQKTNNN